MKIGRSLQDLAAEIERRANAKKDVVAPTSSLEMVQSVSNGVRLYVAGDDDYAINNVAHDQIGAHTGIPSKYYDRMLAEQPQLLSRNVNTWLRATPEKRMVRTLDGTARAFLSDKYR